MKCESHTKEDRMYVAKHEINVFFPMLLMRFHATMNQLFITWDNGHVIEMVC